MALSGGIPIPSAPNAHRWLLSWTVKTSLFHAQNPAKDKHFPISEGPYCCCRPLPLIEPLRVPAHLESPDYAGSCIRTSQNGPSTHSGA